MHLGRSEIFLTVNCLSTSRRFHWDTMQATHTSIPGNNSSYASNCKYLKTAWLTYMGILRFATIATSLAETALQFANWSLCTHCIIIMLIRRCCNQFVNITLNEYNHLQYYITNVQNKTKQARIAADNIVYTYTDIIPKNLAVMVVFLVYF